MLFKAVHTYLIKTPTKMGSYIVIVRSVYTKVKSTTKSITIFELITEWDC